MNEYQAAMIDTVRIDGDAWFALGDKQILALQLAVSHRIQALEPADPDDATAARPAPAISLACAAPTEADLTRNSTLPLLIVRYSNGMREWLVDSDTNMLVAATDLDTGNVRCIRPLDRDKRMRERGLSASGPMPDAFEAATTGLGIEQINLLGFGFTTETTRLALSAIDFDVRSNVVTVNVAGQERPPRAAPLADATPFVQPQPFDGPTDVASAALMLPGEDASPGRSFALRGDVRVPAPSYAPKSRDGDGKLLPVTLLFVQRDRRAVEMAQILVPVQASDGMLEGGFTFDLWHAHAVPDGRTQLYLVAGSEVAGPYPIMHVA
ncbi:MAG TPA: hypothetical protein VGG99_07065 [Acetobacteraceae bacterium]|jgi:hypothetical protein